MINANIYLYGAGRNGKNAFYFLTEKGLGENVRCFIDNARDGEKLCNLDIYSYQTIKDSLSSEDTIIITPDMEVSASIFDSLIKNGKERILFFEYIEQLETEELKKLLLEENNYYLLTISQKMLISLYRHQAEFLATHASAKDMKPADGELREYQLKLIELTAEFYDFINPIGIKPYLEGGNLLGYVRHNGFIPWDDDMDLTVVREDYDKLISFSRDSLVYRKYSGPANNHDIYRWINREISENIGKTIFLETPLRLRIHKGEGNGAWMNNPFIDIIPIDQYKDGRDYGEHLRYLDEIWKKLETKQTAEEQYSFIVDCLEDDRGLCDTQGKYMCFGLDSLEGYFNRNKIWHLSDNVFPLKETKFEGIKVWVPNNPEDYLKAEFGERIMELPRNAALHVHRRIHR